MSVTELNEYDLINGQRHVLDKDIGLFPNGTYRFANFDIDRDADWLSSEERGVADDNKTLVWFVTVEETSWNNWWIYIHYIDKATVTIYNTSIFLSEADNFYDTYQEDEVIHFNYNDDINDPFHVDFNMDTRTFSSVQTWWDTGGVVRSSNSITYANKVWTSSFDKTTWGVYDFLIPFLNATDT